MYTKRVSWTRLHIQHLKRYYKTTTNEILSEELNRPIHQIVYMARKLKLKKGTKHKTRVSRENIMKRWNGIKAR